MNRKSLRSSSLKTASTKPEPKRTAEPIKPFSIGGRAKQSVQKNLTPTLTHQLASQSVEMDAKSFKRMKAGKLRPDARIDLHGKTLDQAFPALREFILSSYARGDRLALVITGKGKSKDASGPIPTRTGVLKHQVPAWLRQAPLNSVVLQVAQASVRHGGSGAYYVYLRRSR
jgi:DNA-nicking Smr family endonuclease